MSESELDNPKSTNPTRLSVRLRRIVNGFEVRHPRWFAVADRIVRQLSRMGI